jgi:hypothetical protein
MNNPPEITPGLLALVRAKAEACAGKAAGGGDMGAEWQRQADEWRDLAAVLQADDALAPLVPLPPRQHRF